MSPPEFKRQHQFLIGIDSDGCVFDSMELKHKECFIPAYIKHFRLQGVSKYAREAAEFVNLYSTSRGVNRFPALIEQLDWLRRRPEVQARGIDVPRLEGLRRWIAGESKLGNPSLQKAVAVSDDPDLKRALEWSLAVNAAIADMVSGVPPFPFVRPCLQRLSGKADMFVASATPGEALVAEWNEHALTPLVGAIYGQEFGTKREMLAIAREYAEGAALMIGDAPGDYAAAAANGCLFFPINPGHEEQSWRRLFEEGVDRFLEGAFAGEYQKRLLEEFDRLLPKRPPWPVDAG